MKALNLKRAVLAGLAANLASFVIGGGGYVLFGWVFRLEPTGLWKWTPDSTAEMSAGWWALLVAGNTLLAVVVALVYAVLFEGIPGRGVRKGLAFGLVVWLVGVLPATFTVYVLVNISGWAVLYFTLQGLVEHLAYGAIIAAIYGEGPRRATPISSAG